MTEEIVSFPKQVEKWTRTEQGTGYKLVERKGQLGSESKYRKIYYQISKRKPRKYTVLIQKHRGSAPAVLWRNLPKHRAKAKILHFIEQHPRGKNIRRG